MNRYYISYPGGFANEYTVYVVDAKGQARFQAAFPRANRISRRQAIDCGWTRPRKAKQAGEHWFGGFVDSIPLGRGTLADHVTQAKVGTLTAIGLIENEK